MEDQICDLQDWEERFRQTEEVVIQNSISVGEQERRQLLFSLGKLQPGKESSESSKLWTLIMEERKTDDETAGGHGDIDPTPLAARKVAKTGQRRFATKRGSVCKRPITPTSNIKKLLPLSTDEFNSVTSKFENEEMKQILDLIKTKRMTEAVHLLEKKIQANKHSDSLEVIYEYLECKLVKGLIMELSENFKEAKNCYWEICGKVCFLQDAPAVLNNLASDRLELLQNQHDDGKSVEAVENLQQFLLNHQDNADVDFELLKSKVNNVVNQANIKITNQSVITKQLVSQEEVVDFFLSFENDSFSKYLHLLLTDDNEDEEQVESITDTAMKIPATIKVKPSHSTKLNRLINGDSMLSEVTMIRLIDLIVRSAANSLLDLSPPTNEWISANVKKIINTISMLDKKNGVIPEKLQCRLILSTFYMSLGYLKSASQQLHLAVFDIASFVKDNGECCFSTNMKQALVVRFAVLFFLEGKVGDSISMLKQLLEWRETTFKSECYTFLTKILVAEQKWNDLQYFSLNAIKKTPSLYTDVETLALPALVVASIMNGYSRDDIGPLKNDIIFLAETGIKSTQTMKTKMRQFFELKALINHDGFGAKDYKADNIIQVDLKSGTGDYLQAAWKALAIMESYDAEMMMRSSVARQLMVHAHVKHIELNEGISTDQIASWIKFQKNKGKNDEIWTLMKTIMQNIHVNSFLSVRFGFNELVHAAVGRI